MKRSDVVKLVAYVTQLAPAQQFDEYTSDAWHDVLGDLPASLDQARTATAAVAKEQQWIYPSAIREKLLPILAAVQPREPAPAIEQKRAWEQVEDRPERMSRGLAAARAAVRPFPGAVREDAPEVPDNLKKAREVAAEYRAGQAYRDRSLKLGRPGAEVLKQINHQRAVAREGGTDGRP